MPISAQNIAAILRKRRAYGSLTLGSLELDARQSVGPTPVLVTFPTPEDAAAQPTSAPMFTRNETSGRLVYRD